MSRKTHQNRPALSRRDWADDLRFRLHPRFQDPPCEHCSGLCCQRGPSDQPYAVLLDRREVGRYAKAVEVREDGHSVEVLPYRANRCVYLDGDNRCSIYAGRPRACRRFTCLGHWLLHGPQVGHGRLLEDRPDILKIIRARASFVRVRHEAARPQ